jgi:hypothetical protein
MKAFSNWPTFPQLYVKGELAGGCDIVLQLQVRLRTDTVCLCVCVCVCTCVCVCVYVCLYVWGKEEGVAFLGIRGCVFRHVCVRAFKHIVQCGCDFRHMWVRF